MNINGEIVTILIGFASLVLTMVTMHKANGRKLIRDALVIEDIRRKVDVMDNRVDIMYRWFQRTQIK